MMFASDTPIMIGIVDGLGCLDLRQRSKLNKKMAKATERLKLEQGIARLWHDVSGMKLIEQEFGYWDGVHRALQYLDGLIARL